MTEDQLEQETLGWLADLGYAHRYGPDIAFDGTSPERKDYREVLLTQRLSDAIDRLNPGIPLPARQDALQQVVSLGIPALLSARLCPASARCAAQCHLCGLYRHAGFIGRQGHPRRLRRLHPRL